MAEIEKEITVEASLSQVYNQWTQFESFPEFMEGVEEVRQLDEGRLRWRARLDGRSREWDAVITQQVPDEVVGWRSTEGPPNAGNVRFRAAGAGRTLVRLHMHYQPEGPVEGAVDSLGFLSRRVEGDLERFKRFIEGRGSATGAWRGEIHNPAPEGTQNPESA